jgi:HAE1 family hydrophobic/amphiphilic exporter-1
VEELGNLTLFSFNIEDVDDVLLSNVANVETVNNSDEIYAKINGHDGVLISFMKQSNYSTAEAAANVWSVFEAIGHKYPAVTITPLSDQSVYIDRVSKSSGENLIIGAILAILVLLVFLRDIRPTLVVAVSIPASILFAVALMYFTGVTLNIFSLAGLALGVGMLVDNSIVVMENIYRCRSIGLSPKDAAIEGTKQVGGAIIASTLTTVCVFLPVVFTSGLSKELFTDIGLTITYALLASLFIAFSLIPALSSGLLRRMNRRYHGDKEPIRDKYEGILRWVLSHRVFTIVFVLMLLIFSVIFTVSRGTSFMPKTDGTEMTLTITMQEQTTESVLWQTTDNVVSLLMDMDDVASVGAVNDTGGTVTLNGISEGDTSTVYVVLKDDKKHSCSELSDMIFDQTQYLGCDIDISIGSYDLSTLYQDGINIVIRGDDLDTLSKIAKDMGDLLLSVEGITNVKDTMDTATPSLKVTVDKAVAMSYGLTVEEVYAFVTEAISNSANATTLSDTDVIVIDDSTEDLGLADIQNLIIEVTDDNGNVSNITIGSIATITEEEGAAVIYRSNQERYMTASAEVADDYNVGLVSKEVTELVAGYDFPEGYSITIEGESSVIGDSLYDLVLILGLALLLIYLIMVAQFQSLLSPFIVMITVPLAFTGGFLALLVTGLDISVIAVVGFLLLSGVIVNNGIVLVDYINRLRRSGKLLTDAIVEGGRTRMRPIVMTATTTVLALITLAFGFGMGAEIIQPMAVVILGGMIYATFMTLFIVPVLYDLLLRRREDDIAESGLEYYANDEETREAYFMEKRRGKTELEEEETEKAQPGLLKRIFGKIHKHNALDVDAYHESDEDTDNEEEDSRRGFFHLRRKIEKENEENDAEETEDYYGLRKRRPK